MHSGSDFDYAFETKLIMEIKKHPLIYDFSVEDYKNTNLKEQTWNKIGFKVSGNEKSTDKCKKKWRNLRDFYKRCRARKKIRSAQKKQVRAWKHEKIMQFLDKSIDMKKLAMRPFEEITTNFDDDNSISDDNNDGSFSPIDDIKMEETIVDESQVEDCNADTLNEDSVNPDDMNEDSMSQLSTSSAASRSNIKLDRTQEEKLTEYCSIKPTKPTKSKMIERDSLSLLFESLDKKIQQANLTEDEMTEIESSVFSLVFFKLNNFRKINKTNNNK